MSLVEVYFNILVIRIAATFFTCIEGALGNFCIIFLPNGLSELCASVGVAILSAKVVLPAVNERSGWPVD